MKPIITERYEEMSRKAARMVKHQVLSKPGSVLGLPTGDTPLGMYRELVQAYQQKELDFAQVTVFNLDEYCGLGKENEQSYAYYMQRNLYDSVNVPLKNRFIPDGTAPDFDAECKRYEKQIKRTGGIDLMVLGIGTNGHIGFNEPADFFEAETHLVQLSSATKKANARFFTSANEVPDKAISVGIKTIMQAKELIILAYGAKKTDAVYKMVKGKISPRVPASIVQLHSNATVIIGRNTAKQL